MQRFLKRQTYHELEIPGGKSIFRRLGENVHISLPYSGVYGMGEKYNALNQKGKTVVNKIEEHFCFQNDKTYCSTPFFWTDTGLGVFADTCETTVFTFNQSEIVLSIPDDTELVIFIGKPDEIIREYMNLFGKAVLPPAWVFEPWISANHWDTQEKAEAQLGKLKEHNFPAGVIVLEAWSDEATFYLWNGAEYQAIPDGKAIPRKSIVFHDPWPDPESMIKKFHEAGLHVLLWQVPVYKKQDPQEPFNSQNELDRADAIRRSLCVKNADGTPYTIPEGHWFAGSMIPDFTNQAAKESWFSKRQYLLDMGIDGFKTDGGEFVYCTNVLFADGSTGKEGINRYARDYEKSYQQFICPNRVLFSRAGWSGQHTVPIHWAGDQQSQNEELKSVLRAGLSAAASGILFWGFDIAGFAGPMPSLDLYRRATQLACFCPIMQWHSEPDGGQFKDIIPGIEGNNERSPWNIAEIYDAPKFLDEMRFWYTLRQKLLPYIWKTAQICVSQSLPMMRPLVYYWPDDPFSISCEDEFLLGENLLIAPLMEENATHRAVYLPDGQWTDFFTGKEYFGKQSIIAGSNGKLPVFVRDRFDDLLEFDIEDAI